jgi:RNA polymerase sigma-70 factor (ECF subfamily)
LTDAWALAELERDGPASTDDELAVAARSDADAFAHLYLRHRLTVYRYARSRTSSEDDAIDLTALTFERALSAIGRYRPSGSGFVAWLLRIARNAAIDQQRRARPVVGFDFGLEDEHPDNGPEDLTLDRERRRAISKALATLSEHERDAVALRYGSGLTARQIGEILGKGEAATQKLLSRALLKLRERIDDDS